MTAEVSVIFAATTLLITCAEAERSPAIKTLVIASNNPTPLQTSDLRCDSFRLYSSRRMILGTNVYRISGSRRTKARSAQHIRLRIANGPGEMPPCVVVYHSNGPEFDVVVAHRAEQRVTEPHRATCGGPTCCGPSREGPTREGPSRDRKGVTMARRAGAYDESQFEGGNGENSGRVDGEVETALDLSKPSGSMTQGAARGVQ